MALTVEDFSRLQAELDNLKVSKYEAESKARKLQGEVERLRQEAAARAKEQAGLGGLLSRTGWGGGASQQAELQALQSQLEDSQLQIRAMRANLADQFETNQRLQKEVDELKAGGGGGEDGKKQMEELRQQVEELQGQLKAAHEDRESAHAELAALRSLVATKAVAASAESVGEADGQTEGEATAPQGASSSEVEALRLEAATWREKYERKRIQLHTVEEDKGREVQDIREQLDSLRALKATLDRDLARTQGEVVELQTQLSTVRGEKEQQVETLRQKLRLAEDAATQHLLAKEDRAQALQAAEAQLAKLKEERLDLGNRYTKVLKEAEELRTTAEKRKGMLDELSKAKQIMENNHVEQLKELNEKHRKELGSVGEGQRAQLAKAEQALAAMTEKLKARKAEERSLERSVAALEEELQRVRADKEDLEDRLSEVTEERDEIEDAMMAIQKQFVSDAEYKAAEISALQARLATELAGIEGLNQKLRDAQAAQRLAEKKGIALVRDLKREVKQNQQRIQRLEAELSEFKEVKSTYSPHSPEGSLLEVPGRISMDSNYSEDSYRTAATLAMLRLESDASVGGANAGLHTAPPIYTETEQVRALEEDNHRLISRVTELQCNEVLLQEKIKFLEQNNALLAQDVYEKSTLIQKYMMDSRAGAVVSRRATQADTTPKKPEDIGDKIASALKEFKFGRGPTPTEMQKRLQSMLEETLTKNLDLQSNLEILSRENQYLHIQLEEARKGQSAGSKPKSPMATRNQ